MASLLWQIVCIGLLEDDDNAFQLTNDDIEVCSLVFILWWSRWPPRRPKAIAGAVVWWFLLCHLSLRDHSTPDAVLAFGAIGIGYHGFHLLALLATLPTRCKRWKRRPLASWYGASSSARHQADGTRFSDSGWDVVFRTDERHSLKSILSSLLFIRVSSPNCRSMIQEILTELLASLEEDERGSHEYLYMMRL